MQYQFIRNSSALVSAIERGIPLDRHDITLAVEHLFLQPERFGPSGAILERILASPGFSPEHFGPLVFALAASHVEAHRLFYLFEKLIYFKYLNEHRLVCLTTALCSTSLETSRKLYLLDQISVHPNATSLVLMGRFFSYDLHTERNWVGLGVAEVIAVLPAVEKKSYEILERIANTPTASVQCQRSFIHALETIHINQEYRRNLLIRILHWPSLCETVHKRILRMMA
jgi:hypothetical protein